ncbi:hypothetical protein CAEBREN_12832 [Caenorhabditis brenneri]|uniref:DUF38 domain-containing protein n=1 Tax=Caenorhabditis brenneri TaxID=135651 RepID=G0M8P3_CAEBE|nr:hypothetical protein CAEBREN_12832 [Caenorhabditis brenneri]
MSSHSFTEEDKNKCFRFFYNANFNRQETLTLSQYSFPQVVFEEVDRAYNVFNSEKPKKLNLNRDGGASQNLNQASLEGMPQELLVKVLENSSSDDQKRLHKTSFGISNCIENNFKTYNSIQIYLDPEMIRTRFDKQEPTVTRNTQIGKKRKLSEDEGAGIDKSFHNVSELIQHLGEVFNERNVKVQELLIKSAVEINMGDRTSELFSGLQKIFETMKNEISVRVLKVTVPTVGFLMLLLEKIKVGHLNDLTIYEATENASLDCTPVVKSPHWPHIDSFVTHVNVTVPLDQVYHMTNAFFKNTSITVEDILKLRDRLVQNPRRISIICSCKHLNTMNLLESLKPCLPPKDLSQKNCGAYQCANKWKLDFSLCEYSGFFEFDCVQLC